mmetsp:Transcript_9199/g.8134  ORF Transcript_9199/g.8134 Transcript_9199/m.8134 type:complete len:80 (+) Transcript_9199:919-1158(+)
MKVRNTLLVKEKTEEIDQENREEMAEIISNNVARSLFNFINGRELFQKGGKYTKACLFLPDECAFFDQSETYLNEIMGK